VRIFVEKRRNSEGGICPEDGREKHQNDPKVPERNKILTYINMFPEHESYCSKSHKDMKNFIQISVFQTCIGCTMSALMFAIEEREFLQKSFC
jgi:hypothetical protein